MKALPVVDKPGKVEMTVGIWSMECFWSSPPEVLGRSKLLPPPYFLVRLSHRWQDKLEVVMCTSGGQYSSIPMPAPVPYPLSQRIFRECSMELQGIRRISGLPPMAPVVNNLPAVAGDTGECRFKPWIRKIPWRRKCISSSILFKFFTPIFLPGESPWTEEPGRQQSRRSQRIRRDWADKHRISRASLKTIVFPAWLHLFKAQLEYQIRA